MNSIKIVFKLSRAKFAKLLRGNMSVLYKKLTFAIHNPLILTEVSFCKSEEHISDFPSPFTSKVPFNKVLRWAPLKKQNIWAGFRDSK